MKSFKIFCTALVAFLVMASCLSDSESTVTNEASFSYITTTKEGQLIAKTDNVIDVSIPSTITSLAPGDCAILSYKVKNPTSGVVNQATSMGVVKTFSSREINYPIYDGSNNGAYLPPVLKDETNFIYPKEIYLNRFSAYEAVFYDRASMSLTVAKKEDLTDNIRIYFVYDKENQYDLKVDGEGNIVHEPITEKNRAVIDVYVVKDPTGFSADNNATSVSFAADFSDFRAFDNAGSSKYDNANRFKEDAVNGFTPVLFKLRYKRTVTEGSEIKGVEEAIKGSWNYNAPEAYYLLFPKAGSGS